jgi:hypothetical protein
MPGEDRPKQSLAIWSVAAGIPDQHCTAAVGAGRLGDIEWMSRGNVAPGLVSVVAHSTAEYGERNYDSPADVVAEGCANQVTPCTHTFHWAIHAAAAFRPIDRSSTEPRCDFRCTLSPPPCFFCGNDAIMMHLFDAFYAVLYCTCN